MGKVRKIGGAVLLRTKLDTFMSLLFDGGPDTVCAPASPMIVADNHSHCCLPYGTGMTALPL
jgi:hypothetical protein